MKRLSGIALAVLSLALLADVGGTVAQPAPGKAV